MPSSENFIELSKLYEIPVDSIMKESVTFGNVSDGGINDEAIEQVNNKRWTKISIAVVVVAIVVAVAVSVGVLIYGLNTGDYVRPIRIESIEEEEIKDFDEIVIFPMEED